MNKERRQREMGELEEWVMELLAGVIPVATKSLGQRPGAFPDFMETTIQWGDDGETEIQLRVSFKRDIG